MTNADPRSADAVLAQIRRLHAVGCQIARVAVPDALAADTLRRVCAESPLPVVADIHFDHTLALASLDAGAACVRVNPGNLGGADNTRRVAEAAARVGASIRVGVNGGSVPRRVADAIDAAGGNSDAAGAILAEYTQEQTHILDAVGFHAVKVSIKASSPSLTVAANRAFAAATDYPLHLGVTEAGPPLASAVKSAVALGALLMDGIGDTVRVSVTGAPEDEIPLATAILEAVGARAPAPDIISCPTCGRSAWDVARATERTIAIVEEFKAAGRAFRPSAIAVMGCAVNGPGEARRASVGLAGAEGGRIVVFKSGSPVGAFNEDEAFAILRGIIADSLLA